MAIMLGGAAARAGRAQKRASGVARRRRPSGVGRALGAVVARKHHVARPDGPAGHSCGVRHI